MVMILNLWFSCIYWCNYNLAIVGAYLINKIYAYEKDVVNSVWENGAIIDVSNDNLQNRR